MNKKDELLFKFFYDLDGILRYKNDYENCKSIYEKSQKILSSKSYSDINLQDEEGNTLLHYAFYYSNKNYANLLLELGANPYIKNKSNKNCFQNVYKNYDFISQWWESIYKQPMATYQYLIKDNKGQNYHPEFRQTLLERAIENLFELSDSPNIISKELKKAKLYSHQNLINILLNPISYNKDISLYLDYMKNLDLTTEHNSQIILKLGQCYQGYNNNINQKDNDAILDYFNSHDFEINANIYQSLNNPFMLRTIDNNKENTSKFFFLFLINKLLAKKFNFHEEIKLGSTMISATTTFSEYPHANSLFKSLSLTHELNKKEINENINKNIKKI